ncbi:hypothetical protein ACIBLA_06925 [Streptomyces sp. NPDC050433]|uniref:hypothetical protein n=1 Tax=unclassified Streptomyces TaxID=2593676 RepID=UPI00341BF5F5
MSEISHSREFDAFPGFPDAEVEAPVGPATPSATGRAARRRRLADWKKQRRRAVVASTVALVGGGLTLAFMPSSRPSVSQAQASSLPDPSTDPSTSSVDGAETDPEAEKPRTRDPQLSENGAGSSKESKEPKGDNSPGSATAITPVDSPAKRKTPPPATSDDARPTAETQPQKPPAAAEPEAPPAAEKPTPQPNEPTAPAPAPPPPAAEQPTEDPSGLCLLGLVCVDLDGGR